MKVKIKIKSTQIFKEDILIMEILTETQIKIIKFITNNNLIEIIHKYLHNKHFSLINNKFSTLPLLTI